MGSFLRLVVRISDLIQPVAEFVSCDSVELLVAFYWNYFFFVCVNRMLATFSKQVETVLLQIAY